MENKVKGYVVMKAVELVHGKRGKTSLVKVLKGSRGMGVEKMVNDFDLLDLWGIFFKLTQEEIEDTLSALMEKGFIYTEEVKSGSYTYPMLCISDEGRVLLEVLEGTEIEKIQEIKDSWWESRRNLEISDRGRELEGLLELVLSFLNLWGDSKYSGQNFEELAKNSNNDLSSKERLTEFIYQVTADKYKEHWQTRNVLDITCYDLTKQLRLFLGALPEMEAQVFRCHFNVNDAFKRPLKVVMKYYQLPEKEMQGIIKKLLSRFSNSSWTERFLFIDIVMKFLNDIAPSQENDSVKLIKETTTVTYDLFKQGLPLSEIAKERGLALSTVITHFAKLIPQYGIDVNVIIPKDRLSCIIEIIDEVGTDSLKSIKEKLPPEYNYGEIKLVLELQRGWQAA